MSSHFSLPRQGDVLENDMCKRACFYSNNQLSNDVFKRLIMMMPDKKLNAHETIVCISNSEISFASFEDAIFKEFV